MTNNKEEKKKEILKALRKNVKPFAWNVDISFAELMLPIMKQYVKDASDTIAFTSIGFYWYEHILRRIFQILHLKKALDNLDKKGTVRFINNSNEVVKVFEDMLIEDQKPWLTKWKMKELLPVEYNHIKVQHGNLSCYRLEIKEEFIENNKENSKIVKYNNKQSKKCNKWRKKYLHWFIDNLNYLWW